MAIFLVILELLSLAAIVTNLIVILKYGELYRIYVLRSIATVFGWFNDVASDAQEEQSEQDIYNLQKWRVNVENDVNFPRVKQYLQETRPPQSPGETELKQNSNLGAEGKEKIKVTFIKANSKGENIQNSTA